jgi:hypothetical protein
MPLPRHPQSVVAPVVTSTLGAQDQVHELLGTAFLVGEELFMSAKHVFSVIPPDGQEIVLVSTASGKARVYSAEVIYQDALHDIAVARVGGWPANEPFSIYPTDELLMNSNVLTVDYSPTRSGVRLPDGRSSMQISANWQKGNVVREYVPDFGYEHSPSCIDLSYPALKGASGAPVVDEQSGYVVGMIVGNIERQLMPAQIERTERLDGTRDEIIRYFLPSAQALRASHLRDALSSVGPAR